MGTTRTLDKVSGGTRLEQGLLSRSGWVVVDDSATLVFDETGWLQPRNAANRTQDLYFFGYGLDFQSCLQDYTRITGRAPLLPRWVLGNWWSRYWPYSADELLQLMTDFRSHEVPLSVCIVDMDWHLVNVGPGINGWTGYTWNRDLFPDPPAFIAWLHTQGLRTALNLHPALGVRSYEAAYPEMAQRLGIDPASGQTVAFDIADPVFTQAYFEVLHHPQEADGVDFWWMDWQQGQQTNVPGLDPLWWLNHLHYHDLGRAGKRPFVFSRWGGLGNHRYPIGFSGDTHVTWDTLAFQPYFTATAANVGYGWWSHDIGGHMQGIEDSELYTRWVQFGVFSPIFRLHSTSNLYHDRRPWGFDAEVFRITRDAMQLRHALIPYLYSLSWLNETQDVVPVRPMYHAHPDRDEAYVCPQQYFFGPDLIVAPYTTPADPDTRLSRQVVWLPPGEWYNFFSGERYAGDSWQVIYGRLDETPVFARAGAIVPLAPRVGWGGVDAPETLDIFCFAGADGRFNLFEDDGESMAYRDGAYAVTLIEQRRREGQVEIVVNAPTGDTQFVPKGRRVRIHIVGVGSWAEATVLTADGAAAVPATFDAVRQTLTLDEIELDGGADLRIGIQAPDADESNGTDAITRTLLRLLAAFRMETLAKTALAKALQSEPGNPAVLTPFQIELTSSQMRALLETMVQAGCHKVGYEAGQQTVVLWNNQQNPAIHYNISWLNQAKWHANERFFGRTGTVPAYASIWPESDAWRVAVHYDAVFSCEDTGTMG